MVSIVGVILPQVKTVVCVLDRLLGTAKLLAKRLRNPRNRLYPRVIEHYITESQDRIVTARLNDVYADCGSKLDSTLAAMQAVAISSDRW